MIGHEDKPKDKSAASTETSVTAEQQIEKADAVAPNADANWDALHSGAQPLDKPLDDAIPPHDILEPKPGVPDDTVLSTAALMERVKVRIGEQSGPKEPITKRQKLASHDAAAEVQTLSRRLEKGQRCEQILDEVKKFDHLRRNGRTVAEIQTDWPDMAIWKVRENLDTEGRHLFDHPNQRETPGANYTYGLLGNEYTKAISTVRDWVKAWRKFSKELAKNAASKE